jgi:ribonuclease HI
VIVHCGKQVQEDQVVWAAVTALGSKKMTNNVAEFVGLHRLLAMSVEKGWRRMHVVGDSELILRMMRAREPPKARRLLHWYNAASRLADICEVASWSHHYRRHNKMADWLANQAMNWKKSVMEEFTSGEQSSRLRKGLEEQLSGDMAEWREHRQMNVEEGGEGRRVVN